MSDSDWPKTDKDRDTEMAQRRRYWDRDGHRANWPGQQDIDTLRGVNAPRMVGVTLTRDEYDGDEITVVSSGVFAALVEEMRRLRARVLNLETLSAQDAQGIEALKAANQRWLPREWMAEQSEKETADLDRAEAHMAEFRPEYNDFNRLSLILENAGVGHWPSWGPMAIMVRADFHDGITRSYFTFGFADDGSLLSVDLPR